jgi:hypothetical protein
MSASKKTTARKSASPAPASKPTTTSRTVVQKKVAATVQVTTPTPVAMLAPTPAAATPSVKPIVSKPVSTTITAKIDVGYGNTLFIRGEGPGLSWDKGSAMDCVKDDLWRIVLAESARAYTFKFLINDVTWSAGPDFTAACGTSITLTPEF